MGIFDELNIRLPGIGRVRSAGMRAEAEDYASSLGLTPGGPGWGDAIRRFVLDGWRPNASDPTGSQGSREPSYPETANLRRPDFTQQVHTQTTNAVRSANPIGYAMGNGGVDRFNDADGFGSAQVNPSDFDKSYSGFRHAPSGAKLSEVRGLPPAQSPPPRDPSPKGRRAAESFLPPSDDKPRIAIGAQRWEKPTRRKVRDLPSGALAELRETGQAQGAGIGTISSGRGDPGGASFGSFQLSTNSGMARAFIGSAHAMSWRHELGDLSPTDPLFKQRWQAIAAREPAAFRRAQQEFLAHERYYPVVDSVWKATGLDVDRRSEAVREAIWSASGQHGDAESFLPDAVRSADFMSSIALGRINRTSPAYDELLIREMYRHRIAYVQRLGGLPEVMRETIAKEQLPRELEEALRMLHAEQRRRR